MVLDIYNLKTILLAGKKTPGNNSIQKILEKHGYGVYFVRSAEEILHTMNKNSDIGCILLDIDLGGKRQGINAARDILNKHDLPLIIISSYSDRETIHKIEEATPYGFIEGKPHETALLSSINQACKLFTSQQKLKEFRRRNSAITQALSDILFVVDIHGVIKEVYTSDESLLAFPSDKVPGKTLHEIFGKEEAERHLQNFRKCLTTGKVHTFEYTLDLQGEVKHFEAQLSRLTDDSLVSIVRDITERKQLSESVRFEQQKLFSIFGSINEIMYIADPCTYEILYANEYTKRIFQKDLVGKTCYRVLQHKDAPCEFCTNDIILKKKGKPYQWEYYNAVVKRDYFITDKIIQWIDGRDVRFELAIDITETKQAKDKVKDLNALLMSIRNVNQLIVQENDLSAIMKGACNILLETRHYLNIEIALLDNDEVIQPVASAGEHGKREWKISGGENSLAPECIKDVVKTKKTIIVTDPVNYCSGCSYYDRDSAHRTILIPMIQGKTLAGILTVCMTPGDRISQDEIDLLKEVAGDLIFAKEKYEADQLLLESEARYRAIFYNAYDGIILQDASGRMLHWNKAAERVFGITEEEASRHDSTGFTLNAIREDGSEFPESEHPSMRSLATGQPCRDITMGVKHTSGKISWVNINTTPLFKEDDSKPYAVVITFSDITRLKKLELERKQLLNDYEAVFNGTQDVMSLIKVLDNNTFVYIRNNRAHQEATGISITEFKNNKPRQLFGKKVGDILTDKYRTCVQNKRPISYEITLDLPGGTKDWWTTLTPIINNGTVKNIVSSSRDITERKKAEKERQELQEQLNQSQKLESVGRLAGGIAHDFNNILGIILGQTEIMMQKIGEENGLHEDLIQIQKAAERSTDLIRQMLAFARKQVVTPRILNLNKTIERMLKMLGRLIGENVTISWKPGTDVWPVKIDPSQIDQLLVNLCINARDAIKGDGQITIETSNVTIDEDSHKYTPGEYAVITVSDTGCGMNAKTKKHIFEPFYTTKKSGVGTGLGLPTVYGIVKQNHGFIDVTSHPGKGSVFTIYFPRYYGKRPAMSATTPETELKRGNENILVVEDEPEILEICKTMLENLGYHVLTASSPQDAIRLVKTYDERIHLLITDVIMSGMNGPELAEKLLSSSPEMKSLFMSGYPASVIAQQGEIAQDIHFLKKPFRMEELATKVREALEDS